MREQDGIKAGNTMSEHLLPKIGASINDEVFILMNEQARGAQALVFRLIGGADRAMAGQNRHALGSARAE
jgi:hypothetical protein